MATSAYHRWVAAGRPWKLARPIADLSAYARRNKIAVLGTIGNREHLEADLPEDHAPFSATAWPKPLPGYVVTAIDLADVRGLGKAVLRDARAGVTPWLKYMNFGSRQYTHSDGFRTGRWNPDTHVHLSIRTDHLNTDLSGYDPLGDDMALTDADVKKIVKTFMLWDPADDTGVSNWDWRADAAKNKTVQARFAWWLAPHEPHAAKVEAAAARADVAKLAKDFTELRKRVDTLPTAIAPAIAQAVGDAVAGGITSDVLAEAIKVGVREVLGSLDDTSLPKARVSE